MTQAWARPTMTRILDTDEIQISRIVDPHEPETIYVTTFRGPVSAEALSTVKDLIPGSAQLNDIENDNGIWHLEFVVTP